MSKLLFFVLLLATAQSQNLDDLIEEVFGITSTTDTKQMPAQNQSENTTENAPCKLSDGRKGTCVAYYLCPTTSDGDFSVGEDICSSFVDVCCPEDKKEPKLVKRELQHDGCGWSYPIGLLVNLQMQGIAQFGEFPWRVAILNVELINDKDPKGPKINVFIGTGTLIHPSVVLVAAHYAATGKKLKIRAGEWDSQTTKEIYPYQDRNVASVETHENYDKDQKLYAIALVFITKPFDLGPNVKVACLPPRNFIQKEGTSCFGTGWGKQLIGDKRRYTTLPKRVEFPVIGHDECKERLGSLFGLDSTFMCAGGDPGKETCWNHGISGLSCPIESQTNRYVETGIIAWGVECGEESTPAVFVDVSVLRDWIDDRVSAKGYDPKTFTY